MKNYSIETQRFLDKVIEMLNSSKNKEFFEKKIENVKDIENLIGELIHITMLTPDLKIIPDGYGEIKITNNEVSHSMCESRIRTTSDIIRHIILGITQIIFSKNNLLKKINDAKNEFMKKIVEEENILEIMETRFKNNKYLFQLLLKTKHEKRENIIKRILNLEHYVKYFIVERAYEKLNEMVNKNLLLDFEMMLISNPLYFEYVLSRFNLSPSTIYYQKYTKIIAKEIGELAVDYLSRLQYKNEIIPTKYLMIFEDKNNFDYYYKVAKIDEFIGLKLNEFHRLENGKKININRKLDFNIKEDVDILLNKSQILNNSVDISIKDYDLHIMGL